jgi:hypothetical protein
MPSFRRARLLTRVINQLALSSIIKVEGNCWCLEATTCLLMTTLSWKRTKSYLLTNEVEFEFVREDSNNNNNDRLDSNFVPDIA